MPLTAHTEPLIGIQVSTAQGLPHVLPITHHPRTFSPCIISISRYMFFIHLLLPARHSVQLAKASGVFRHVLPNVC